MIRTCVFCGATFDANRKRDLCDECAHAVEKRIYHPTHGVCCVCGAVMTDARRGKKYCSKKCKRISRRIIAQRWHVAHPEYKEVKKPAPKEKPEEKKSFLSDVEDLGRKMGYGGYGQMMAVIRARCQRSGLSVRSEFCHLKFVYEKEHCHD